LPHNTDLAKYYHNKQRKYIWIALFLAIAAFLMALLSVHLGAMPISAADTLTILAGKLTRQTQLYAHIKDNVLAVVWEIRLPRIFCGLLVGAGLAIAGVIFQAVLQNPLADPYTIGVSTGAAFGASVAIYCNILWGTAIPIVLPALISAILTLLAVLALSSRGGGLQVHNLIIAGIIISSILSAGISFIKMLAGENVSAIVYWLMGSLNAKSWTDFLLLLPVFILVLAIALHLADDLNILTLGNREAQMLGVPVVRTRLIYLLLASAMTAVCVSICGVIGFIGLIVPHLLRFWLTADNKILLPLSALLGALLLCSADTAARLLYQGGIPVGILTTLLGGPFFLYIFLRRKGGDGS